MNTKKESFKEIINDNKTQHLRDKVLDEIKRCPGTIQELSFRTNIPINILTARRRELEMMGKVICLGVKKNEKTNKHNKIWGYNQTRISLDKFQYNYKPRKELLQRIEELEKENEELRKSLELHGIQFENKTTTKTQTFKQRFLKLFKGGVLC